MIDSIGFYITRSGARVKIVQVGKSSEGCMSFKCKGYIERIRKGKRRLDKWGIWHESGAHRGLGEHPLDIIAKENN